MLVDGRSTAAIVVVGLLVVSSVGMLRWVSSSS
jgi:hypothetical protein